MSNKTPIYVTGTLVPSGTSDVNIVSSIPLIVSASSLPLPTGAATESTLLAIKTDLDKFTFTSTRLLIDGSGATQPISGSVSVFNFPGVQAVSQSGSWTVSLASGSIEIGTVDQGTPNAGGALAWPVAVSNFPSTQLISGTVTANQGTSPWIVNGSGFTQPVSGAFFQATQPISAASLPLPIGAATEATLSTLNTNIAKEYGTWTYYAGTSGTVSVTAGQRILSISCHATTVGTVAINGGVSIPIPANVGFSINMTGILIAPTAIFTGTDSYFIEAVS